MTAGLTTPLDEWVAASARPPRKDILDLAFNPASRPNYSSLSVEDAFPLLVQICKTRFGDLSPLEFSIKESRGPLMYSASLTITGPDDIGIEFPASGGHATVERAKVCAAYRAVLEGAIEFIIQSEGPVPNIPNNPLPPPNPAASSRQPIPGNAEQPQPSERQLKNTISRQSKNLKPQHPTNEINVLLQRVFRDHKMKMPKSSQKWENVQHAGGVAAQLTVMLPSGKWKSYGSLSANSNLYPMLKDAKLAIAKRAIELGVLDFIRTEELNGQPSVPTPARPPQPVPTLASALPRLQERPRPKVGNPLPTHAALSNYVAFDPSTAPSRSAPPTSQRPLPHSLPAKPTFLSKPSPARLEPLAPARGVAPAPVTVNNNPIKRRHEPHPHAATSKPPPKSTVETTEVEAEAEAEVEAVDDLLGPGSNSKPDSVASEVEDAHRSSGTEDRAPPVTPSVGVDRRLDALNLHDDGKRGGPINGFTRAPSNVESEAMDLDSNVETPPPPIIPTPPTNTVDPPPNTNQPEALEERPTKRQRTEPSASPAPQGGPIQEVQKFMRGNSYINILAEFCSQTGHTQPKVTYQRHVDDSKPDGPAMYHVSIVVNASRYELSKQYESVELAEEKLSKRILRRFGVRAKKI